MKGIDIGRETIALFCRRWEVVEFVLFGSAARGDFREDSDIDVMVDFAPGAHPTLFDLSRMRDELEELFGREVDLLTRRGVEQSANYLRRRNILSDARVIYAA